MDFFKQVIKDLRKTGAVAPSSKFLARDLVEQLQINLQQKDCPPLNILELGPGTGPLTKEIVKLLRPQDHLDIVEIQRNFYEIIEKKFEGDNIEIHFSDILHFDPEHSYDYIFSSLPYENMPKKVNRDIWQKKLDLCSPHAYICYFKYIKFKDFKYDFEQQLVDEFKCDKKFVLRNIPPAKLYTLEVEKSAPQSEELSSTA